MQRFYAIASRERRRKPYFFSAVADARLHVSGYAVLPWVFVYGAVTGPRVTPVELVLLGATGSWGVLCVKYLPRSLPEGMQGPEAFRYVLTLARVRDPDRWTFVRPVSMAICMVSAIVSWFR